MSLYGPLARLEEERRLRQLRALDIEFDQIIHNLDAVKKVNEEAYQAKRALLEQSTKFQAPQAPKSKPKKKR